MCVCEECQPDTENKLFEIRYRIVTLTRYRDDLATELVQVENERAMLVARMAVETWR